MNKFIKTLIIINGLILPFFLCFLIYKQLTGYYSDRIDFEAESIIVGEELELAKKDSLALQGISYEEPIKIYNSTNLYLPISAMTYKEAKELREVVMSAGDVGLSYFNYFNVVFLDKDYNVIGQLVDKKASIANIHINQGGHYDYDDTTTDITAKHIVYTIGFLDSNKDGKLNSLDDHDLFISDLDGKNLVQMTFEKKIIYFQFINSNSEIFIQFKDRNAMREEYKYVKFATYNIANKTFKELKGIENKLLDIEAQLIR